MMCFLIWFVVTVCNVMLLCHVAMSSWLFRWIDWPTSIRHYTLFLVYYHHYPLYMYSNTIRYICILTLSATPTHHPCPDSLRQLPHLMVAWSEPHGTGVCIPYNRRWPIPVNLFLFLFLFLSPHTHQKRPCDQLLVETDTCTISPSLSVLHVGM